jgi:hypothetical protein
MTATVLHLHSQPTQVAGFLRVGHTGQRRLEALHAAGRFAFRRVVFDAAHIEQQTELLKLLKASGCEIVLDPNFAEMATEGRFASSSVSKLPWAPPGDRPWAPGDFGAGRNADTARFIAEFAVKHGVNVVLAPTHLIEHAGGEWRRIDLHACERLRIELDRLGAHDIAVDYQLITTAVLLKDEQQRRELIAGIDDLPIDNIWLRVSGFGATATGAGTRHFIETVRDLHQLGRPLVADGAGGFAGLAAVAYGAVGGLSHGVGQKESFRASDWKKPPGKGGGNAPRAYVPELDRHFTEAQLEAIFSAKGGKSRFGCNDTSCCRDVHDMIENNHAHFLTQRSRQLDSLSRVPENRRAEEFLLKQLDPALRSARLGSRLKIADETVSTGVEEAKTRLRRLRDALGDLHATEGAPTRSRAPGFRGGGTKAMGAVLGS